MVGTKASYAKLWTFQIRETKKLSQTETCIVQQVSAANSGRVQRECTAPATLRKSAEVIST
jgi:hypothetical protein